MARRTFGTNKYGKTGGEIYIIQTEFDLNVRNYYKIGMTTNIYKRVANYRTSNVYEPRLHYYYPFKNIKSADKDLKKILHPYQFRREIFKGDLEEIREKLRNYQKEVEAEITLTDHLKEVRI